MAGKEQLIAAIAVLIVLTLYFTSFTNVEKKSSSPSESTSPEFVHDVLRTLGRIERDLSLLGERQQQQQRPSSSSSSSSSPPPPSVGTSSKPVQPRPLSNAALQQIRSELADGSQTPLQAIASGKPYRRVGDFRALDEKSRNKRTHVAKWNSAQAEILRVGGKQSGFGWKFIKYVPSKMEDDWFKAVQPIERQSSFNQLRPQFQGAFQKYMEQVPNAMNPDLNGGEAYAAQCAEYVHNVTRSLPLNENTCGGKANFDAEVFSRFEYEFVCLDDGSADPERSCDPSFLPTSPALGAKHTSYIEPLVGLLRHPRVFTDDGVPFSTIVDKQYMFVDKWAINHLGFRWQHTTKRSLYFDMGASSYTDGAGGASQNWFVGLMQCVCAPPSDFFLWEVGQVDAKQLYKEVPGPFRPSYHYYNIPLEVPLDSWNNPLNVLLEKYQQGDVVVMKIDFDNGPLETAILDQILQYHAVSGSIDELFFEHHVQLPIMLGYWGSSASAGTYATHSIRLFQQLRERGIRAHSWV